MLRCEEWLRGAFRVPPGEVGQALVLEYRLPLGCCVHMTPVFEAMKRGRPEMKVIVATRALGADVLRHSPFVDHLIVTPDPLTKLMAAARGLRGELNRRALAPECVLTGASDMRTRIALLGLLGSGGWRGGYTLKPALYHLPLAYEPHLSLIANNLRVARLVGCETVVERPRVFVSAADVRKAESLVAGANPRGLPLVTLVTQNSGGQRTGWHTERWVRTIQAFAAKGLAVAFVGTAGDAAAIEAIQAAAGGLGHSLAGRTSVGELAAVLAMSDAVVSLDTGTMHVARAVGVPMVVLGPSWQRPVEWMPLGVENVRILRGQDREDIPADYHLDEITAQSVIGTLEEVMKSYPGGHEGREARVAESVSTIDHLADGRRT